MKINKKVKYYFAAQKNSKANFKYCLIGKGNGNAMPFFFLHRHEKQNNNGSTLLK